MHALFVHGMGRSPVSGWPLLWKLKRRGLSTSTFGYSTAFESFSAIIGRLVTRISVLSAHEDYVLIGHSLGGVLLRAAINALPPEIPRPKHLFLLASPIQPSRLAQRFSRHPVYRVVTSDCGQMLASSGRMVGVGSVSVPTTAIAGTRSLLWTRGLFTGELNDGIVSLSEVSAAWLNDQVHIHAIHTLLPSSARVSEIILERLGQSTCLR
jgi:hypothetical protein